MKFMMKGPETVRARVRIKKRKQNMNLLGLRDRSPRMSCTTDVKLMVLDLRVFNRCCEERLFLNASIFMSVPW